MLYKLSKVPIHKSDRTGQPVRQISVMVSIFERWK